jgi:alpha-L-fucosidase
MGFRDLRAARFDVNLAARADLTVTRTGGGVTQQVRFKTPTTVAAVRLAEDITRGQHVAGFAIHGETDDGPRELARGQTIGYARIERFAPVVVRTLQVTVQETIAPIDRLAIHVYAP